MRWKNKIFFPRISTGRKEEKVDTGKYRSANCYRLHLSAEMQYQFVKMPFHTTFVTTALLLLGVACKHASGGEMIVFRCAVLFCYHLQIKSLVIISYGKEGIRTL